MMRTFSLGVLITSSLGEGGVDPGSISTLASRIAALGVDALFLASSEADVIEPVTALAAIAGSNDLVLGAIVSLGSGRNPAIVAKSATALGLLAPGRCALLFQSEADDDPRLLEAVEVAVALMRDGPVSAGGAEFFVRDAYNEPRTADADRLAVGAIVSHPTPRLISACDLVLSRVFEGYGTDQDAKVLPLLGETAAVPGEIASLVVQVDGHSIDHVADVVASVVSKRR
jgi:hypothetical protein